MSWFSSFMHPGRGYDKAMEQLQNYYNQAQGYRQPWIQQGQDVYKNLWEQYNKLVQHPEQLQDEWNKNYTESGQAKDLERRALSQGQNAASSMGLGGSSSALRAIQGKQSEIVNADRDKYLADLMQKYMTGLGIGKDVYGTGAGMASGAAQGAENMGQNAAQLAFNRQQAGGNMFGNAATTAAALAAHFFGL